MNDLTGVALAVVLLLLNGFFVAAEFALISARRDRLESLVAQGRKSARTVIAAGQNLSLMLAAAQLGITICSILLGRVGEPAVAHLIEAPMAWMGVPDAVLHPIAFALALALVVVLHILIGEMVPKNLAIAGPERTAMMLVPAHLLWLRIAHPLIWFYNLCANVVLRTLRVEPKDELSAAVSADELSEMILESRTEGLIDEEEHRRLTRALQTTGRTVRDVLIPLDTAHTIFTDDRGPTLGAVEAAVRETGYSRYPVRDAAVGLIGYLHLKDVLTLMADESAGPETVIDRADVRPLPLLDVSTPLDEALSLLRRQNAHLGAVVEQHTGTVGIVALEDLVEEFVGTAREGNRKVSPNPWLGGE